MLGASMLCSCMEGKSRRGYLEQESELPELLDTMASWPSSA